jgi:hypothetical protein
MLEVQGTEAATDAGRLTGKDRASRVMKQPNASMRPHRPIMIRGLGACAVSGCGLPADHEVHQSDAEEYELALGDPRSWE